MSARSTFINYWNIKEKTAVFFLLKLLFLLSLIKLIFFITNHHLISVTSEHAKLKMLLWSLFYDVLVLVCINLPFLLCLWLLSFTRWNIIVSIVSILFMIINVGCLLINIADIPYFHFHLQRADADLLYVLKDPLPKSFVSHPIISVAATLVIVLIAYLIYRFHKNLICEYNKNRRTSFSFIIALMLIFIFSVSPKKYIPTYPLTNITSSELLIVQNSMHTFLYSVFRNEEAIVRPYTWMKAADMNRIFSENKMIYSTGKRNIVLFIMESVPEDYFNKEGKYKVKMPFLDSLLQHATYFSNAYSYSHNSNKGIVALLSGLPTLTEIPLYHSSYADLPKTAIGKMLSRQGYTTSFTIGDAYDDFGFAKCCNWMGIQSYVSRENIPGSEDKQNHTMGLHDQYVLQFVAEQLKKVQQPFFTVYYNISTHYPNDLPSNYKEKYPEQNFSTGMKSMQYYSTCLQEFFKTASQQKWLKETVFIFASDHWMFPDTKSTLSDITQRFHIPLFIYDPLIDQPKIIDAPVSQLDVLNIILHYSGINQNIISYGEDIVNVNDSNRIVCMKENSALYQAIDKNYVIGFNPVNDKVEFVYDHKKDPAKTMNLAGQIDISKQLNYLKAFLQKASWQYNKKLTDTATVRNN